MGRRERPGGSGRYRGEGRRRGRGSSGAPRGRLRDAILGARRVRLPRLRAPPGPAPHGSPSAAVSLPAGLGEAERETARR